MTTSNPRNIQEKHALHHSITTPFLLLKLDDVGSNEQLDFVEHIETRKVRDGVKHEEGQQETPTTALR